MKHTGIDGKAVAERLRSIMAEREWTQAELAKHTGFKEPLIAKWLRGETPKDYMLYPIVRRLGMTVESLIGPHLTKPVTVSFDIHGRNSREIQSTERAIESIFGPRPTGDRRHHAPRSDFGRRLMEACRARGIDSQATLARRLGCTQPTVSGWMTGRGLSTSSQKLVCFMLGVNRAWLFHGIGPMDAPQEPESVTIGITANELRRIRGERVPLLRPPPRSAATVLNMRLVHPDQLKYRPAPVGVAA